MTKILWPLFSGHGVYTSMITVEKQLTIRRLRLTKLTIGEIFVTVLHLHVSISHQLSFPLRMYDLDRNLVE